MLTYDEITVVDEMPPDPGIVDVPADLKPPPVPASRCNNDASCG
jgi:hypothetical protein